MAEGTLNQDSVLSGTGILACVDLREIFHSFCGSLRSMTRRWVLWIGAAAAIVFLLIPPLRWGWTHVETDFPNYYTAAVLLRQRAPLRNFYDWTWFQRQMNYAGTERQLGGYIPHSPLTMLPIVPLAGLSPQSAKQVWLSLDLIFLAATIWMLSRITRLPAAGLLLLALLGHYALAGNFELGQYYIFLLFLLTASCFLLLKGRDWMGGSLLGIVFVLKGYGAPFLLYLAWKRRWRALAGMIVAISVLGLFSIFWFGWQDNLYYVTGVFARAMAGESVDPYAPGMPTIYHMLRHTLSMEPELNPNPLAELPAVCFFLQAALPLALLVFCLIALPRRDSPGENVARELAWVVIMAFLITPSRAFYTSIVLLLPISLLLDRARRAWSIGLIAAYLLLSLSLPQALNPFFPTLWILIALYAAVGIDYWRNLRPAFLTIALVCVLLFSTVFTMRRMKIYYREPPQKFERVHIDPGAIYSASPAVSRKGVVYETIGQGRYELKAWTGGQLRNLAFDGHAVHPTVPLSGDSIYFELIARGHSQIMRYRMADKSLEQVSSDANSTRPSISPNDDAIAFIVSGRIVIGAGATIQGPIPVHDVAWFPKDHRLVYSAGPIGSSQIYATTAAGESFQLTNDAGDHIEPAVSPNGLKLAYTVVLGGTRQIWLRDLATGKAWRFTDGNCNSYTPTWAPDSETLIFASDCERALGLGTLFRARASN